MGTIANLVIKINGDIKGLQSALDAAGQSVKATGEAMQGMGTKMSLGVTAPIVGVGLAAIKAAADQEQLMISFTTMLGSAERAKTLMEDLNEFAALTPFEGTEVQNSAKMLLAFGVAAEDMTGTLRQLGDLSAGVGAPLQDLAYLFGTSRTQGRLFAADINQFTSRGIPIIGALAATMGVAENQVKSLVEEGKVGFPELQGAMEYMTGAGGQFAGLMEAQSQSILGMWSTFKDNITLTLAAVGKILLEQFNVSENMTALLEWMGGMKDSIIALSQENPELFRMGVIIAGAAALAGPALIALGTAIAFAGTAISGLGAAIGFILSPIGLLVGAVAILGAAWLFNWGGMRDIVASAWEAMQPTIEAMQAGVSGMVEGLVATWGRLTEAITTGKTSIGELTAALTGSQESGAAFEQWLSTTAATLTSWGETASAAFATFAEQAQAIGQQLAEFLEPAFARVGEAFGTLSNSFYAIQPQLVTLGETFGGLVTAIQPLVEMVGVVLAVAASLGINAFAAVIANLPGIVGPIISQVTATIQLISTTISEVVALVKAIIAGDWSAAWTAAQNIVGGFKTYFETTFGNVKTFASTTVGAIKTAVTDTLTDMGTSVQEVMNTITGWWSSTWEGLKSGMQPMLDGITAVNDAITGLKSGIEGFKDWIAGITIPNPFAGITLPSVPSWMGGPPDNQQLGTSYFRGGLTWVGERGRELVALPRGSQVFPNGESMAMAGAGGVSVTIQNANIRNERDLWELGYRIADINDRRSRS